MRSERQITKYFWKHAVTYGCLMAFLSWAEIAPCAAQVLQWKLAPDDQFSVQFLQTSETRTAVANRTPGAVPRKTTTTVVTTLIMDWEVLELDSDENAIIEQSISRIALSVTNPALPSSSIEFDTSSNEKISTTSQAMLTQVTPLIGLKFRVTMSGRGEIVSVDVPETTQTALRKLPGSLQIQSMFTEQGIKDLLGSAAMVLPAESVESDPAWSDTAMVATAFGEFERTRKYNFSGIRQIDDRNLADFKIASSIRELSAPAESPSGLVSFSETGNASFDIDAGFFRNCRVRSLTETESDYREKKIQSTVENSVEMTINKL